MKNTKILKILFTIIAITAILCLNNEIFATNSENLRIAVVTSQDPIENVNRYKPEIINQGSVLEDKAGTILGYINTFGVVASVITIMIVGIKYMIGSVDEKAEYKKTMINYLIGAFLLFSITTVANIIYNFADMLNK